MQPKVYRSKLKLAACALLALLLPASIADSAARKVAQQSSKPVAGKIGKTMAKSSAIVPVVAQVTPVAIKRDILALYDSATETTPAATRLHRLLEMPLNHLGYRLQYWDIAAGMPPAQLSSSAAAFATWFSGRVSNADAYFEWARRAVEGGTKAIVIDSVGALGGPGEIEPINGFLRSLGLEYAEWYVSDPARTRIVVKDDVMIGIEQKLEPKLLAHQVIRTRAPNLTRHLVLSDPGHVYAKADDAVQVVTGPAGGLIAPGFAIRYDPDDKHTRWIVDPFRFLTAALGNRRMPIPDVTTQSGRRIYFSHIDGDSWNARVALPNDPGNGAHAARIVERDLIAPFPDLPVSVGLIAADVDPSYGGDVQAADIARRIFALPQAETASHTHSHPFDWGFFAAYDRKLELAQLLARADNQPLYDRSLIAVVAKARAEGLKAAPRAPGDPYSLPRVAVHKPYTLDEEVAGALAVSSRLAPSNKPARLYLWSGNTAPPEHVIKATRAAGVRNMNGGDPRYDSKFPSLTYLPPLGKPVGAERQIYAAASNEHTYTNDWTGPFDGFKDLVETWDNTERPRRLKPQNLYYHMYAATKSETLASVRAHLERVRASPIAPIEASRYAAMADSFYGVEIAAIGADAWRITARGDVQTLRFDDAAALAPDYALSRGVVGHTHANGALYVTLDPDAPTVDVALTDAARQPARPHLVDSRWSLNGVAAAPCRISGRASGYGFGEMTWAGLAPGRYDLTIEPSRERAAITVDATGRASFALEATAQAFSLSCSQPDVKPEPKQRRSAKARTGRPEQKPQQTQ